MYESLPGWLREILPILLLLSVIWLVLRRLPKLDFGHPPAFLRRRTMNWLPLGLTYAFLYMGRYNLNVCKNALGDQMSKEDFATIFATGTFVYGFSFLINGPLADRIGGKATILISAVGSLICNGLMGLVLLLQYTDNLTLKFSLLYAANMYFQSFGAVSIVKVQAPWFHVRERGVFGGIFGILISLGIYFAYDWGQLIVEALPVYWVFFVPAIILAFWAIADFFLIANRPEDVGYTIETGDHSAYDEGPAIHPMRLFHKMLSNPIILTICMIEFCSGYLRQAIMQWYTPFAKEVGASGGFVAHNWGLMLCVAGITGGIFAGTISDRVFQARRGPVAAVLYGLMVVGAALMFVLVKHPAALGWLMVVMSLAIIGVHGMLSGSASVDFGGKKNTGLAVGLIDGFVYLGTGLHAIVLGQVLPSKVPGSYNMDDPTNPANWWPWAVAMLPVALIGLFLSARMWNVRPPAKSQPTH